MKRVDEKEECDGFSTATGLRIYMCMVIVIHANDLQFY